MSHPSDEGVEVVEDESVSPGRLDLVHEPLLEALRLAALALRLAGDEATPETDQVVEGALAEARLHRLEPVTVELKAQPAIDLGLELALGGHRKAQATTRPRQKPVTRPQKTRSTSLHKRALAIISRPSCSKASMIFGSRSLGKG